MEQNETKEAWHPLKKIVFRFSFIFILIVALWFAAGYIFPNGILTFRNAVVNWTTAYLLHIDYQAPNMTGSGDTRADYVWMLCFIVFSLLLGLIWTLLDRARPHYRTQSQWLLVITRYTLAFVLMSYGFSKVFELQFQFPGFRRLLQRFGDASPMGLAWTFMGYSPGYNWFAGGLEALGGLLLFPRRTASMGALISIGVMGNIVMMNLCFDIPVKIYSTMYLLMAVGILVPDMKRLLNILVLNRATEPRAFKPYFSDKRWIRISWAIKAIVVGWMCFYTISDALEGQKKWGKGRPKHALYGLYRVESFVKDGLERPPLVTDEERYHYVFFEYEGRVGYQTMDGKISTRRAETDTESKTITINPSSENAVAWKYELTDPDTLSIEATTKDGHIVFHAKRESRDKFLLVNRGFNWINESPYNR